MAPQTWGSDTSADTTQGPVHSEAGFPNKMEGVKILKRTSEMPGNV